MWSSSLCASPEPIGVPYPIVPLTHCPWVCGARPSLALSWQNFFSVTWDGLGWDLWASWCDAGSGQFAWRKLSGPRELGPLGVSGHMVTPRTGPGCMEGVAWVS